MKRILVLLAVLALVLSLFAGCDRSGADDDGTNVSTSDNGVVNGTNPEGSGAFGGTDGGSTAGAGGNTGGMSGSNNSTAGTNNGTAGSGNGTAGANSGSGTGMGAGAGTGTGMDDAV